MPAEHLVGAKVLCVFNFKRKILLLLVWLIILFRLWNIWTRGYGITSRNSIIIQFWMSSCCFDLKFETKMRHNFFFSNSSFDFINLLSRKSHNRTFLWANLKKKWVESNSSEYFSVVPFKSSIDRNLVKAPHIGDWISFFYVQFTNMQDRTGFSDFQTAWDIFTELEWIHRSDKRSFCRNFFVFFFLSKDGVDI